MDRATILKSIDSKDLIQFLYSIIHRKNGKTEEKLNVLSYKTKVNECYLLLSIYLAKISYLSFCDETTMWLNYDAREMNK